MPEGFSWAELKVDAARVHVQQDAPLTAKGKAYVLYWCMVNHRAEHNHALDAALALGQHLELPVVVYHAFRPDFPHASDRLHAWVLEGMQDLQKAYAARGIAYWMDLPKGPENTDPRIPLLAPRAAAIVTDFFPTYIVPKHLHQAVNAVSTPLYAIDASCVVPTQRIPAAQVGAYALRPKLRKLWPEYLDVTLPRRRVIPGGDTIDPLFETIDPRVERAALSSYVIDHDVPPVANVRGGRKAGLAAMNDFIANRLDGYDEGNRNPSDEGTSGLSPYLHWGMLWAGEIARAVRDSGKKATSVDRYLEELLVRRELGFNYCFHTKPAAQLKIASLPAWAQRTLADHADDPREHVYTLRQLERGETADPLWNAAQRELRESGRIHGYLRMLWGKKILEWSRTPKIALEHIEELNDRFALDGRDPASVANFMWILGLHDRPFQERKVIGKVRPMSSLRTAQKFDLGGYLARWG